MENISKLNHAKAVLIMHIFLFTISLSLLPKFFASQGYSLPKVVLAYMLASSCAVVMLCIIPKYNLKYSLMGGLAAYLLVNVALFLNLVPFSYIAYVLLICLPTSLYWIPLNYQYFNNSQKQKNGTNSSLYLVVSAIFGIILPPLSAIIIKYGGYNWLFGVTALLYLIPIYYTYKYVPTVSINTKLTEALSKFKRLKTITLMEGIFAYFFIIIPIYVLLFITDTLYYGMFMGYIGLIGGVVAIGVAYLSDKSGKRMSYLWPLFLFLAACIFGMYFVGDGIYWMILIGIFALFNGISNSLRMALSMDVKEIDLDFWRAREIFLNLGRVIALGIALILFYYQHYEWIFLFYGMIALAYPFMVRYKYRELK